MAESLADLSREITMTGMTGRAIVLRALSVALTILLTSPTSAHDSWAPSKPVEFIVMAGAGGGADQMARFLQRLIREKDLSPRPFIPINISTDSGAKALRFMRDARGDNHKVMITLNSFYTASLVQPDLDVDVSTFTLIGRMAMDTFLLWVHAETDIEDLDDYIEEALEAGENWNIGGTGVGQEDAILTAMMDAELGLASTYVPFPGGGAVATNLVRRGIDATVNNPAEQNVFYRAGRTKPLVQFTPERMAAFPDIPTAKELGHDIVYFMQRSIVGPPDMDARAKAWYIHLFETIFRSDEWQQFCRDEGLSCDTWLAGDDLSGFHTQQLDRHRALIDDVGVDAILR